MRPPATRRFRSLGKGQVVHGNAERSNQSRDGTVLVLGDWRYIGRGHTHGEAIYAGTLAQDAAGARRLQRRYREEQLL